MPATTALVHLHAQHGLDGIGSDGRRWLSLVADREAKAQVPHKARSSCPISIHRHIQEGREFTSCAVSSANKGNSDGSVAYFFPFNVSLAWTTVSVV